MIALTKARIDPQTKAYLGSKRAESKTGREALRCSSVISHARFTVCFQCQLSTRPIELAAAISGARLT
jgi:hypothetical protein